MTEIIGQTNIDIHVPQDHMARLPKGIAERAAVCNVEMVEKGLMPGDGVDVPLQVHPCIHFRHEAPKEYEGFLAAIRDNEDVDKALRRLEMRLGLTGEKLEKAVRKGTGTGGEGDGRS